MATERYEILFDDRNSTNALARDMQLLGVTGGATNRVLERTKTILASLGLTLAAREVLQYADSYTVLQNRLASVTNTEAERARILAELSASSRETRTDLAENVILYQRLRIATNDLGFAESRLLGIQELINKALVVGGASAIEQQNALRQLTQGLASGALRGDEFRSVSEQLPFLLPLIAKELGVTTGELKKFAEQGKITTEVIIAAFENARAEIEGRFAKTIPPLSQSLVVLRNQVVSTIGEFDQGAGGTRALSQAVLALADNLDTVARVSVSLGAGYAALRIVESERIRGIVGLSRAQLAAKAGLQTHNETLLANARLERVAAAEAVAAARAQIIMTEGLIARTLEEQALSFALKQRIVDENLAAAATQRGALAQTEAAIAARRAELTRLAQLSSGGARIVGAGGDATLNALLGDRAAKMEALRATEQALQRAQADRLAVELGQAANAKRMSDLHRQLQVDKASLAAAETRLAQATLGVDAATTNLVARQTALGRASNVLISPFRSLFGLVRAHPFGSLAFAVGAAGTALYLYRDRVRLAQDSTATLGDVMRVARDEIDGVKDATVAWYSEGIQIIRREIPLLNLGMEDLIRTSATLADVWLGLAGFNVFKESAKGLASFIAGTGEAENLGAALDAAFAEGITGAPLRSKIEKILAEAKERALLRDIGTEADVVLDFIVGDPEAVAKQNDEITKLRDSLARLRGEINPVVAAQQQLDEANALLAQGVESGNLDFFEAIQLSQDYAESLRDQLDPYAATIEALKQEAGLLRLSGTEREVQSRIIQIENDLRERGIKITDAQRASIRALVSEGQRFENLDRIREQFASLVESVNPIRAAQSRLAEGQRVVNLALAAGVGDAELASDAIARLGAQLQDDIQPMEAWLRTMQEEADLLRLSASEREIERQTRETVNQLIAGGVVVQQAEIEVIRQRIRENASLAAQNEADAVAQRERQQVIVELNGDLEALARREAILNSLLAEGTINARQHAAALGEMEYQALRASRSLEDGLNRALIGMQLDLTNTGAQVEQFTVNTFRSAEDALIEFFQTGKLGWREFADVAIEQLQRILIQQLLLAPLAQGIQSIFGFGGGAGLLAGGRRAIEPTPELFPLAKGGVSMSGFSPSDRTFAGNVADLIGARKLAKGDIMSMPTFLAAEAGRPEAVLPLTRLPSGDLGVQAAGGGGRTTIVHVNAPVTATIAPPAGSSAADQRRMMEQAGQAITAQIRGLVREVMMDEGRDFGIASPSRGAFV